MFIFTLFIYFLHILSVDSDFIQLYIVFIILYLENFGNFLAIQILFYIKKFKLSFFGGITMFFILSAIIEIIVLFAKVNI